MIIQSGDVAYEVHDRRDVEVALADIAERAAQREAIRQRFLHWSPRDEPMPRPSDGWLRDHFYYYRCDSLVANGFFNQR